MGSGALRCIQTLPVSVQIESFINLFFPLVLLPFSCTLLAVPFVPVSQLSNTLRALCWEYFSRKQWLPFISPHFNALFHLIRGPHLDFYGDYVSCWNPKQHRNNHAVLNGFTNWKYNIDRPNSEVSTVLFVAMLISLSCWIEPLLCTNHFCLMIHLYKCQICTE